LNKSVSHIIRFFLWFGLTLVGLIGFQGNSFSFSHFDVPFVDTPIVKKDTLLSPIEDRTQNKYSEAIPKRFDLGDPKNIKTEVDYNPEDQIYSISERIGNSYYRAPSDMTFDEFLQYQAHKDETAYFRKRANTILQLSKKGGAVPKVNLGNQLFDRIFGGSTIEMKPQGNIEMFFGGNWQNIKNPTMVQSAQKYGIFDFDMNMNINLLAKVGEKMRMNFNYNTKATFDFENQLKLEYTGQEDDIIKKIEAGYISFPLKTSLIQGVQSLFGIHTQLQFGRLRIDAVASQQKSKRESFSIKGGAQTQNFAIPCDQYEDFRHFLLGHTFRREYNTAMKNFPIISSLNNITRMEVWVTNRSGVTENARDIVAFMDLGESQPYRQQYQTNPGNDIMDNNANGLYSQVIKVPGVREVGTVVSGLQSVGLNGRVDFEKTYARKLNPSEYTFNAQLGFLSVNSMLQPDDVIGVAYEYTNNGKVFQVGEFAQNMPPDSSNPKILFLKMLKSTAPDPTVPLWDLMMKNVYSLGSSGIAREEFVLNVFYQDPGGGEKRFLPEGPQAGIPLIRLLNLDRLNNQNDPQPDGRFDFVEGITINAQQGKIIFPVLEPFGEDLKPVFGGNTQLEKKYLYKLLYDSTRNIAIQFPQFNRFLIKGSFRSANSSEIYLGGFNIPQGSVSVFAGGQKLTENVDYTIDYGIGKLKIINNGILNSGIPINVSYENNATFGFQMQNLVGTRLDYFINENLTLGGTMLRLSERPFFNKVNFGEDPIKNTALGLDVNFQKDMPGITRFIDRLPIISTTSNSMIQASGEVAKLIPGHSRLINDETGENNIYLDDFEGTRSGYDLKFPVTHWSMASTPQESPDRFGNIMFPEAKLVNNWDYGKNRARMAWYNLDPCMADPKQACMPEHMRRDTAMLSNHYLRLIQQQDVFPLRSYTALQGNLSTLDLAYYPKERGPYNFDASSASVNANGELLNPARRWAGIMRPIDYSDFETANVEFIEFWLMDPFINRPNDPGGFFYINLGNVSEDILKDSRKAFENGLPYPVDPSKTDQTKWSKIPKFQQQITAAFDNDPSARAAQDVGIDGMTNAEEAQNFQQFLTELETNFGANSTAYLNAINDPANDDFHHFRGSDYDNEKLHVLKRYRKFNSQQGNSPVQDNNSQFSNSFTNVPDAEDINRDNTLNENEQYFQYRIQVKPDMQVGENFIVNKQIKPVVLANGNSSNETWYQFKVPILDYTERVGAIADFRSIRFFRMFLTGFQDSVIMRFARLELGRNQWRRYNFSLKNPGEMIPEDDRNATTFNLISVSVEENSSRSPIPYVIPPGIQRQQQQVSNGQSVFQNEQALSIQVCGLADGDARGAFKSLGVDLRQFRKLRMFIHAEATDVSPLQKGDLRAFIRLGSDFVSNYYEYQIPLTFTQFGARDPFLIWPTANELDLDMTELVQAKDKRNKAGWNYAVPYEVTDSKGNIIRIIGNPNIGDARSAMLGVLNPKKTPNDPSDDGSKKCTEVWFNELRVSSMNEEGGYAAMGRVDMQLADIANVKFSGNMHTAGYGNIDQKVNQRFRDNFSQFDLSTLVNAGKLLPKKWGVQLPVFAGYTQSVSNPIFDPYDLDIKLADKIDGLPNNEQQAIKEKAQDFTSVKSINVQNIRIVPTKNKRKEIWDFQNFDLSYSFTQTNKHNALVENDQLDEHALSFGYSYTFKTKPIEPFKKLISSKKKYFQLIRDLNINLIPSNFTFRNQINRTIGETQVRNIDEGAYTLDPLYFKFFTWNRTYNFRWDLTKSLSFDYNATNNARIDEPNGRIDTKEKRDTLQQNIAGFGRNTIFNQSINASYNVPLNKFPLTDWTTLRATYGTTYNWAAASLLASNLGNTLGNTQTRQVNAEANFTQLYNKSKMLKKILAPKSQAPAKGAKPSTPPGAGGGKDFPKGTQTRDLTSGNKANPDLPMFDRRQQGAGDQPSPGMSNDTPSSKSKQDEKKQDDKKQDEKKQDEKKSNDKSTPTPSGSNQKTAEQLKAEIVNKVKSDDTKMLGGKPLPTLSRQDSIKKGLIKPPAKKKKEFVPPNALRLVGGMVMMLKRATMNYNENMGTILPGYMDSTQSFGMNVGNQFNPGGAFVMGYQPNRQWLEARGRDGIMTRDSLFNNVFRQQFTQTFNFTANLEPVKDFKIDVTMNRTFNKGYSELFKDTVGDGLNYVHLNPYENGGFQISYIALNTMFQPRGRDNFTQAFNDFENNRQVISSRLGLINPYTANVNDPLDKDFKKGYTRYSQEVLIPAFLSAYRGKDPQTFPLLNNENVGLRTNPFRYILPMPNWRVNYNGLSKLKLFKPIFQSFTLTHGYTGSLSMNSFMSSLQYRDAFGLGFPSFIDSISGNYIPFFMVPNMTMTENFGPLIGIDATFKNSLNIHIDIKKSRTLSMSLIDFQLSETKSNEIAIGGGMRFRDVTINTPLFGLNKYKSDVNVKLDVGVRDDYTTINRLDQRESRATRGQKVVTFSPSIDYLLTKSVTLRFFVDRRQSIPYVSNAFPITTTRGGLMVRFLLGQ